MLENDSEPFKRQAHPRNRTNNRRNSHGDPPHRPDRLDRPSSTGCETGQKLGSASAPFATDRLDRPSSTGCETGQKLGSANAVAVSKQSSIADKTIKASVGATSISGQVDINGRGDCEALRFMNERWKAALQSQNDPTLDIADRPVVYCSTDGSSSKAS